MIGVTMNSSELADIGSRKAADTIVADAKINECDKEHTKARGLKMQRGQQETQGPAKAVTMVGAIGGTACSNMHNKQQPPSPEMMKV
jgi:hypothetical protein